MRVVITRMARFNETAITNLSELGKTSDLSLTVGYPISMVVAEFPKYLIISAR